MSMLAMVTTTPHSLFRHDYAWDHARPSATVSTRPRTEPERIALPSIRQAFPELQLRVSSEDAARASPTTTSPVVALPGVATPPEYVHSPRSVKRRRLSMEGEREERVRQVPRLYTNPVRVAPPAGFESPSSLAPRSATESWTASSKTSPFLPLSAGFPPMRSPAPFETAERTESGPALPTLARLSFDHDGAPLARVRGPSADDFLQQPASRPAAVHPVAAHGAHNSPSVRPGAFAFAHHHPSRTQSLSLGSIHPFDRSPYSGATYGGYHEYMQIGDLGAMTMNGDSKQRKRRGNLPKETTDKLRSWFMAHLHHPYPTEDEKQELMRQTGLQMNQISNWFINARRRQLPTMINNARAESDAMSGRSTDGKVLPSLERSEYDDGKSGTPLSEDGRNASEDELAELASRRSGHRKRGSV